MSDSELRENRTVVQIKLHREVDYKTKTFKHWQVQDYVYASLEAAKAFWTEFLVGDFMQDRDCYIGNLKQPNQFRADSVILKIAEVK